MVWGILWGAGASLFCLGNRSQKGSVWCLGLGNWLPWRQIGNCFVTIYKTVVFAWAAEGWRTLCQAIAEYQSVVSTLLGMRPLSAPTTEHTDHLTLKITENKEVRALELQALGHVIPVSQEPLFETKFSTFFSLSQKFTQDSVILESSYGTVKRRDNLQNRRTFLPAIHLTKNSYL